MFCTENLQTKYFNDKKDFNLNKPFTKKLEVIQKSLNEILASMTIFKNKLDALSKMIEDAIKAAFKCPICQDEFDDSNDTFLISCCQHKMCKDCAKMSLENDIR